MLIVKHAHYNISMVNGTRFKISLKFILKVMFIFHSVIILEGMRAWKKIINEQL